MTLVGKIYWNLTKIEGNIISKKKDTSKDGEEKKDNNVVDADLEEVKEDEKKKEEKKEEKDKEKNN